MGGLRLIGGAPGRPGGLSVSASTAGQPPVIPKIRFEDWPVVWLWPIGLVLMQLTFLRVDGFDVTLAVIVCHLLQLHLLLRYWLDKPSAPQVVIYLGGLVYALALVGLATDAAEFLRSIAHITNLVVMIALCMNARFAGRAEIGRSIGVFCWLAIPAALAVIVQAIAFNVWNDLSLTRLLGDFTPVGPGEEPYAPHELAPVKRANGWFSEPSVAAWFLAFAAAVALSVRRERPRLGTLAATACLAGAVATLTLTGLFAAVAVTAVYVLFVKDSRTFKLVWLLAGVLGAAMTVAIAAQAHLLERMDELSQPGTSVYFRFTAPYLLVSESLDTHPFGYPVGQVELIENKSYYMNWEEGSHTNIDNMLFVIVFHFGVLGIFLNLTYVAQLARLLILYRRPIGLLMVGITLMLLATGAGWAHQSALMIGYAIAVGRYLRARPEPVRVRPAPPPPLIPRLRAALRRGDRPPAAPPRAPWQPRGAAP